MIGVLSLCILSLTLGLATNATASYEKLPVLRKLPPIRYGDLTLSMALARSQSPNVIFIDVRSPTRYAAGHVPGARNLTLTEIPKRYQELEKELKTHIIVLYCDTPSCPKADRARRLLTKLGRRGRINIMRAGFVRWQADGLPVETSSS